MVLTDHLIAQWEEATNSQPKTRFLQLATQLPSIQATASLIAETLIVSQRSLSNNPLNRALAISQVEKRLLETSICFVRSLKSATQIRKLCKLTRSSKTLPKLWRLMEPTIRVRISLLSSKTCFRIAKKTRRSFFKSEASTRRHSSAQAVAAMPTATAPWSQESLGVRALAMVDQRTLLPQIRITQVFYSNPKPVNRTSVLSIKSWPEAVLSGVGLRPPWISPRKKPWAKN